VSDSVTLYTFLKNRRHPSSAESLINDCCITVERSKRHEAPSSILYALKEGDIVEIVETHGRAQLIVDSNDIDIANTHTSRPPRARIPSVSPAGEKVALVIKVAGLIGFVLGGPLSGALAFALSYVLHNNIKSRNNSIGIGYAILIWLLAGTVAMPASWWISRNMGWNFDAVALVQSQGQFKSYRDWSRAEDQERKVVSERENQQRERELVKEREERDQERRAEAAIQAQKEAQNKSEELEKESIRKAEWETFNDPLVKAEREKRHFRHLQSVGCIDPYGRIIENTFCLNTESPSEYQP
jgi:flagellar biosynthesis GTPase FlhF